MKCIIMGASKTSIKNIIVNSDDYIIASDGGYNNLLNLNIKPNLLVGDFDSITDVPNNIEIKKFKREKDETDTYLAIEEGIKRGYNNFELYGCLGNRPEHTIANIQNIVGFKKKGINCTLIDENTKVLIVSENESVKIFEKDSYISLFSYTSNCVVSIKNMKYNLEKYKITNTFPIGLDNEPIDDVGLIEVHEGTAILIISKKKD